MREHFVTELVREVLGPRGDINEVLVDNPGNEYLCGVLAPLTTGIPARDADADAVIPETGSPDGAEDDDSENDLAPPVFSPVLDPSARPHSIGLSFVLREDTRNPRFDLCVTWARYSQAESGWIREPRWWTCAVTHSSSFMLDGGGQVTDDAASAEISVHALVRHLSGKKFLCSVHLVNRIRPADPQWMNTTEFVFQPQIRVHCHAGTRVVPGLETTGGTEEDERLRFLYRHHPLLARGHLCSAVWKAIDPENNTGHTTQDRPAAIPFIWPDGTPLDEQTRSHFSPADVRTDFVPMLLRHAPDFQWQTEFGPSPELSPDVLSEKWQPVDLRAALDPLLGGYSAWVRELAQGRNIGEDDRHIAAALLGDCENSVRRITRGIQLLEKDAEARLSFCLAMKAIAVQSKWGATSEPAFFWRPFQLAFVLMTIESVLRADSADRNTCDLLWVSTGGGKTETYLALIAAMLAYRRRRAITRHIGDRSGAGVGVISRYTLRLLTIQQFRRALKLITALEYLRTVGLDTGGKVGWRPAASDIDSDFLWGSSRFSVGLWVGGSVTPNHLQDIWTGNQMLPGALSILKGESGEGEPAQILRCPACDAVLSVPNQADGGMPAGSYELHLVVRTMGRQRINADRLCEGELAITAAQVTPLPQQGYAVLSVTFTAQNHVSAEAVDEWWRKCTAAVQTMTLQSARASRPGYFIRQYPRQNAAPLDFDFEIFCPNPHCVLRHSWTEGMPSGWQCTAAPHPHEGGTLRNRELPDGNRSSWIPEPFRSNGEHVAAQVPIPAFTVDDQVYSRCPSVVVATVDKFARPAFEPRAAALFGNVDHHHNVWGYYRWTLGEQHPAPLGSNTRRNYQPTAALDPPDLIVQDELHLIEGPLGSLMGLYETGIDYLAHGIAGPAKYIASSATIRQAEEQVKCVFDRSVAIFPSPGYSVDDSFFVRTAKRDLFDDSQPGQLYLAIAAPGKGPLTPLIRIWSRLLQTAWDERSEKSIDPFWTLTGYFNAIRELAGTRALYRQDIPERIRKIAAAGPRDLPEDRCQELSSRTRSTELPQILDSLNTPSLQDAVFTTSMFGTGVDVKRLGLMVVNGQPKTTSSYIQATGRVGRGRGALVVVFLRASRPRDLNHYEFFCGYHEQLHRFVEPVTVMPFAPGAVERALGPAAVLILRNRRNPTAPWQADVTAGQMPQLKGGMDVRQTAQCLERRAQQQPATRRPGAGVVHRLLASGIDRWSTVAALNQNLTYVEYAINQPPQDAVVLGDAQHEHAGLDIVYHHAPQSLREIEETCGFQI